MDIMNVENLINSDVLIVKIGAIFAFAVIFNIVVKFTLNRFEKISKKTKNFWDDSFVAAAFTPSSLLIWAFSIKIAIDSVTQEFYQKTYKESSLALKIVAIALIAKFLSKAVSLIANQYIERGTIGDREADRTTIDAVSKLARISILIIAILTIMQNLGFSMSGILAAGGVGGLVIGLAAKDMLANLFGGLTIYMDRPFSVGDWIRCDEKSVEGVVEYIGWRQTRLRSFNKNPIYIPNAAFTNVVVENPSRMTNRRIKEVIGVRYMDMKKVRAITQEIEAALNNNEKIDQEQRRNVSLSSFGASSVDLSLVAYTKTTDVEEFSKIKQDLMLEIAEIINNNDADIAFPTRTLYVEKDEPAI